MRRCWMWFINGWPLILSQKIFGHFGDLKKNGNDCVEFEWSFSIEFSGNSAWNPKNDE